MKLLLLNQDWFADEFRTAGHQVLSCGLAEHLDCTVETPLLNIHRLRDEQYGGFDPDVIIVHDNSAPIIFEGLAETDIPIVFYSVDAHHHMEYHRYLAHLFDYTFVAQRDYIAGFQELGVEVEWMPLWASIFLEPDPQKEYGAVFVGTLDEKLNPARVKFFNALQEKAPMLCKTGYFSEIFPKSEIVINQTVKGDVNFRVFEAMMSGAMLLTERSPNGLLDLFEDGKHLVTYQKNDVEDAAEKISYYTKNKDEARVIGKAGREEVLRKHLAKHRAARFLEVCETIQKRHSPIKHLSSMINFNVLSQRLAPLDTQLSMKALISALKAAQMACKAKEPLSEDITFHLAASCAKYDRSYQVESGYTLIKEYDEKIPDQPLLKLYRIRELLNRGQQQEALQIAQNLSSHPPEFIFSSAEDAIASLLEEGEGE